MHNNIIVHMVTVTKMKGKRRGGCSTVNCTTPTSPLSFHLCLPSSIIPSLPSSCPLSFHLLSIPPSFPPLSLLLSTPPFPLFLLVFLYAEPPVFCDGVSKWRRSHVPHPSLTQVIHCYGFYAAEILCGLQYLHSRGIIYR